MASIYRRGRKWWIRYRDADGKWTGAATDYFVDDAGSDRKARQLARRVQERIDAGIEISTDSGPLTVRSYSTRWVADRRALEVADWSNDEGRLRLHVLPHIGEMPIEDVRPKHILKLVRHLRKSEAIAPKTLHNIYSVMRSMFRDALIEDLVDSNPCILTKHHLGVAEDADPEWRDTAIYTRDELQMLISDPRIPFDRQVLYGLEGLADLRHGEAAGIRWRHYNAKVAPLHGLLIAYSYGKPRPKNGVRHMPVHPVLASMLAEWRLSGWELMMGRQPGDDDLIVPRPPEHSARQRSKRHPDGMRDKNYSGKRLKRDLRALGLRHRRGHDLRRTFISLARTDGARADLLERVTHNPRKRERSIDVYSTFEWKPLCLEVAKLKITRLPPSALRLVSGEADSDG